MIYFIGEHETEGPVKIGYTTGPVNPLSARARLTSLQCGNPRELVVLAMMPGRESDEAGLHRRFIRDRVSGEWFSRSVAINRLIRENRCEPITVKWSRPIVAVPPPMTAWGHSVSHDLPGADASELEVGADIATHLNAWKRRV
jgi:hypothetical protein